MLYKVVLYCHNFWKKLEFTTFNKFYYKRPENYVKCLKIQEKADYGAQVEFKNQML
jgi:hypothetical protein